MINYDVNCDKPHKGNIYCNCKQINSTTKKIPPHTYGDFISYLTYWHLFQARETNLPIIVFFMNSNNKVYICSRVHVFYLKNLVFGVNGLFIFFFIIITTIVNVNIFFFMSLFLGICFWHKSINKIKNKNLCDVCQCTWCLFFS